MSYIPFLCGYNAECNPLALELDHTRARLRVVEGLFAGNYTNSSIIKIILTHLCRKITLTKHIKRHHPGPYMSPALTEVPEAVTPNTSYYGSPARSTASHSGIGTNDAMTPSSELGLGISLSTSSSPVWSESPPSLSVGSQRSSSRISNRSAPGCIQSQDGEERMETPESQQEDMYPSPALTMDHSPFLSHHQLAPMNDPEARIMPQFARNQPVYLPSLRVLPIEHDQHYEPQVWDQNSSQERFALPSPLRHPYDASSGSISPLHRFELHAPSPTYPQYL